MSPQEAFLTAYAVAAQTAGHRFHLNPLIVLAQAAHESDWGRSFGARTRRNFFGVTVGSGTHNEFWDGAKSQSKASGLWFRVYRDATDGFCDFARLISSNYPAAAQVSFTPALYAKAIAASPYISESNGDNRPAYAAAVTSNASQLAKLAVLHHLTLT